MAITRDKKISATIMGTAIMFFIVGGGLLIADLLEYQEGSGSLKWLPVEGTVKTQSIRLLNRDGGVNHFALNAGYIYHVDDQAYRGDRVAYPNELLFTSSQPEKSTDSAANPEAGKSMFVQYAPEQPVTVFYNPANKKQSTLKRGVSFNCYMSQWLSHSFLLVLALIMFVFKFRKTKQAATAQLLTGSRT